MRISVRSYEGLLLELDSDVSEIRDFLGNATRAIRYRVEFWLDDGSKIELANVIPSEIEVVNEPR